MNDLKAILLNDDRNIPSTPRTAHLLRIGILAKPDFYHVEATFIFEGEIRSQAWELVNVEQVCTAIKNILGPPEENT